MGLKHRNTLQILYLNIHQKDLYNQRPLLGANEMIYDSTGHGKPIYIPHTVLREIKLPKELPFYLGHQRKRLLLGKILNLKYDPSSKSILGDIVVSRRWEAFVLDKFKEGVNGLSTEFDSYEKRNKYLSNVISLKLDCVCLVDRPASHGALI